MIKRETCMPSGAEHLADSQVYQIQRKMPATQQRWATEPKRWQRRDPLTRNASKQ